MMDATTGVASVITPEKGVAGSSAKDSKMKKTTREDITSNNALVSPLSTSVSPRGRSKVKTSRSKRTNRKLKTTQKPITHQDDALDEHDDADANAARAPQELLTCVPSTPSKTKSKTSAVDHHVTPQTDVYDEALETPLQARTTLTQPFAEVSVAIITPTPTAENTRVMPSKIEIDSLGGVMRTPLKTQPRHPISSIVRAGISSPVSSLKIEFSKPSTISSSSSSSSSSSGASSSQFPSPLQRVADERVDRAYKIMHKATGALEGSGQTG
jgi:hypothetical protein